MFRLLPGIFDIVPVQNEAGERTGLEKPRSARDKPASIRTRCGAEAGLGARPRCRRPAGSFGKLTVAFHSCLVRGGISSRVYACRTLAGPS
jgi:hypothetical protein